MKTIYTVIIILLFSVNSFSQTELIAFKSHSGNMEYFKVDGADNLGGPAIMIDSIFKLNDSTIIEYNSYGWGNSNNGPVYTDTVVNHPICKIPNVPIDSLKGIYYRSNIIFIGFDSVEVDNKKSDSLIIEGDDNEEEEEVFPIVLPNGDNNEVIIDNPIIDQPSRSPINNSTIYFIIVLLSLMTLFITILWYKLKPKLQI